MSNNNWIAACPNCGVFDTGIDLGPPERRGSFMSNAVTCPTCHGAARLQDHHGAYAVPFPAELFTAFRRANVVDLEAFRDIASAAAKGELSQAEAEKRAARLDPRLASLLQRLLRRNGWNLFNAVIGLAGLALAIKGARGDDEFEAKMVQAWHTQAAQNELIIQELAGLAAQAPGGPPPRPPPVQPRRMAPEEFKAWWNANRKI